MTRSEEETKAIAVARARQKQWMYWAPVALAPLPYICVTLYRSAKTPAQKQLLVGVGIIGIPMATFAARVYLMNNSSHQLVAFP